MGRETPLATAMRPLATIVPFPVFALLGGLVIASPLGAQQSGPSVRPAVGSSVVLEREMRTEANVDGGDAQSSTRIHTLRVEVKGTDPQGNLVVEVEVLRVHGWLDHGGAQVVEFDSATSERPDPDSDEARRMALTPARKSWQIMALAGESFRATVGDNGLVVDVPGAAHLVSGPEAMGFGTTEALLKELAGCAFFGAPPVNAAAKSSWDVDLAADAVGLVALRRKWKFTVASADADRTAVTGTGSVERDDRVAGKAPADAPSNGESAGARQEARGSVTVTEGTLSYEGHTSRRDGFVLDATRVESVALHTRSSVREQTMARKRTVVTRRVGSPDAPATAVRAQSAGPAAEAQPATRDTLGCYVMLTFPRVRAELKITAEQGSKLDALLAELQGAEPGAVLAVLTAEQRERLLQLSAQCFSVAVCCDPAWARKLGVKPEHQAALHAAVTKALAGLRIGSKKGCSSLREIRAAVEGVARDLSGVIGDAAEARRIETDLPRQLGPGVDHSIFDGAESPARLGGGQGR